MEKELDLNRPVNYEISGMRLSVPLGFHADAYIKYQQWPIPKSDFVRVDAFNITALLPGMEPVTKENMEFFVGRDPNRRVHILVHGREFRPSKTIEDYLELIRQRGVERVGGSDISGLSHYVDTGNSSDEGRWDDIYVKDPVREYFRIYCPREGVAPRCKVSQIRGDGLYLEYTYSREYIKDWRMVDAAVNTLIEKFRKQGSVSTFMTREVGNFSDR